MVHDDYSRLHFTREIFSTHKTTEGLHYFRFPKTALSIMHLPVKIKYQKLIILIYYFKKIQ